MEKGLRNMLNIAASHSRSYSNWHSKVSVDNEMERYLRDRAEREDSGIAFAGDSSSCRSSHSNSNSGATTWQHLPQRPQD